MAQSQLFFPGNNRTVVRNVDGSTSYVLHKTAVVVAHADGKIVLDSGGYGSATTKLAMNQVANQFFGGRFAVSQRKGQWFVTFKGREFAFDDGMVLS